MTITRTTSWEERAPQTPVLSPTFTTTHCSSGAHCNIGGQGYHATMAGRQDCAQGNAGAPGGEPRVEMLAVRPEALLEGLLAVPAAGLPAILCALTERALARPRVSRGPLAEDMLCAPHRFRVSTSVVVQDKCCGFERNITDVEDCANFVLLCVIVQEHCEAAHIAHGPCHPGITTHWPSASMPTTTAEICSPAWVYMRSRSLCTQGVLCCLGVGDMGV